MDADDLAAIPGAAKRVVGRRYALRCGRGGGVDRRVVERPSLQRTLGGPCADLRCGHRAERDARPRYTAATGRQMRRQRDHRTTLWLDAGDLAIAEGIGA